ncbi:MAG: hypothetical protein GQ524_03135 [Anaerolineales bacterium]|nr:hypothetical protein [Anaerolineales bacterium]
MDPATFYKRLKGSKALPTSSQPSPGIPRTGIWRIWNV